ncbi:MAG: putative pyridoxal kinase [Bacteroidetes bacterium]|nr:putative pyridoxal kinase [Bacteroidota bacterium]
MKTYQPRVAAIHDISGFGKCSLTVALPILSAAGIETSVMPTAVLSTHTGGFTGFTYRDLTSDLVSFAAHWKSLNIPFDAIYTGFLGSFEQLNIISQFFEDFKSKDNLILVDPVMADHGQLYSLFNMQFVKGMRTLCEKADIVVPNITEACLLTDTKYEEGPYSTEFIEKLVNKLVEIGPQKVVLTGVYFDDDQLGATTFDKQENKVEFVMGEKIPGFYHGTGDVFASALLSGLLNNFKLKDATQIAVNFTTASIRRTYEAKTDVRFGVNFEQSIPGFLKDLKLV